ncbi:helix-turn-helix domain-containing protein [Streptomyces lydicus]|uniref:helix-turn-helix domain-containing protein n=1 Tax=Streptomyces lydicus TaxID=47763 RepID=UPI0036E9E3FC
MQPVTNPNHGPGQLAVALRTARIRSGMSREQVAEAASYSVSGVQRAEAGKKLPSRSVARALAKACGLDLEVADCLWQGAGPRIPAAQAPALTLLRDGSDLADALEDAYEQNGRPSYREMERRVERRAGEFGRLSRTSAWRYRKRKALPGCLRRLRAYLLACEVPETSFPAWERVWQRVVDYEKKVAAGEKRIAPRTRGRARTSSQAATEEMREAGLKPHDGYPGLHAPWAATCDACGKLSRFRLSEVRKGTACPVCHRSAHRPAA